MPPRAEQPVRRWRWLLGALAMVAVLLAGRSLGGRMPELVAWVRDQGAWAPVLFVVAYAVATVGMLPGFLLTVGAGAVFGLGQGVVLVLFGATLGASAAFLIARYVARPAVERRLARDPRFMALDAAVGREGWRMVLLLRLSPVVPFNLLNYALGLTQVRFGDYVAASIGMVPGTTLYVYSGKLAGEVAALAGGAPPARGPGSWVVLGLGLVATVLVTLQLTRIARRALAHQAVGAP